MKFNDIHHYDTHFSRAGDDGNEVVYIPNTENLTENQEIRYGNLTVRSIIHNKEYPFIVIHTSGGEQLYRNLDEELEFHKVQIVVEKLVRF